jgi:hypothetical protein
MMVAVEAGKDGVGQRDSGSIVAWTIKVTEAFLIQG